MNIDTIVRPGMTAQEKQECKILSMRYKEDKEAFERSRAVYNIYLDIYEIFKSWHNSQFLDRAIGPEDV